MKQSILLLLALCFVSAALAGDSKTTSEINYLASLQPGVTSMDEVTGYFGEPSKTDRSASQVLYTYHLGKRTLSVFGDASSGKVLRISYSDAPQPDTHWTAAKACALAAPDVTIKEVITALGNPAGLNISGSEHHLLYSFAGDKVMLNFLNGSLLKYSVSHTSPVRK